MELDSQEVKDAIAAAVEEATSGLKGKNSELLAKLKQAQKGQSIDPSALEAVETERDQLKADLAAAQKAAKKAASDAEAAIKRAESSESYTSRLLIETGLNEALVKSGVINPVHQKAAKAMLASLVQLSTDGDTRIAKVGEKALGDYVTEWAASEEGKHFVTAANGSGGGAGGGGNSSHSTAKTLSREAFNKLDPYAQAAHIHAKGVVAD